MDIDHERLAIRLDELRRALMAAETYLTQLRVMVAEVQQDLARMGNAKTESTRAAASPPTGY